MLRIWMLVLCLGMVSELFCQSGSNPFDLKYRKLVPKPVTNLPVVKSPIDSINSLKGIGGQEGEKQTLQKPGEDTSINMIGKVKPDSAVNPLPGNPFEKSTHSDTVTKIGNLSGTPEIADPTTTERTERRPIHGSSKGFQIFFLLLSLLLLIFIVNVERSFVRDLWRVIANENYSSLHHRNQRNTMRQILLIMGYAVFIFQAGIFIFNALRILGYQGRMEINIWIPIAFVTGVYIVRHTIIRYLRWLFNNQKEMTLFGFDISIFNTMVGLILLPINVLLLFGPESIAKPLIIIGVIAFVAAYLMRQLRWMLTARQLISNSLFLFFIYLCAVEILPLWALSKYFW